MIARLEEDLAVRRQVSLILIAVEDVLEVEAGDLEERHGIGPVDQTVDTIVSVAATVVRVVVANHRCEIADLKRRMRHTASPERSWASAILPRRPI